MTDDMIHQQALDALACAETRLNHLETIVLGPIMGIVGFEMQTASERQRVMQYIRAIKAQGFYVIEGIERELQLAWSRGDMDQVTNMSFDVYFTILGN